MKKKTPSKAATKTTRNATPKKWTVMVYLAGDNDLDEFGVLDLQEMKTVGSNNDLNIIAQFDRVGGEGTTKRYALRKGTKLDADQVADLGETNTGDPKLLEDFIRWGIANYPAEHYLVVLWNHGAGWDDTDIFAEVRRTLKKNVTRRGALLGRTSARLRGSIPSSHARAISRSRFRRALFSTTIQAAAQRRAILLDDDAKDFLDNLEMKKVVAAIKKKLGRKIDILGMDACLMNMIEVGYQLRGSVDFAVGSEELEPGEGWPYDRILKELAAKPSMSPSDLTKVIVKHYLASYNASENVTQSSLDLSRADEVSKKLHQLGRLLKRKLSETAVANGLMIARTRVQNYDTEDYVDLLDLCAQLKTHINDEDIAAACNELVTAARALIVASGFKGARVNRSQGVSVYFPTEDLSPLYAKLDFAKKTAWDEFLKSYLTAVNG